MTTINVDGAAARLLANKTLAAAGYCLHYCWLAITQGQFHYITGGAGSAYATWLAVPADHQHSSRNVPKDFPAFLGPKLLSKAGDVIISNGDGTFTATDWPKSKQVGICTLAEREKQTGRKFVGWASSMGGYELVSTSIAGETGTPITAPRRHDDMSKLYYKAGTPTLYALAGDSPGTPANWLETTDQALANGWSAQIGAPSTLLSPGTFDSYKAAYLAPLATSGGTGGGGGIDYDQLAAAVAKALPKTLTLS